MGEIILIRHAQASFGALNYDKLSAVGDRQAQALAQWWQQTRFTEQDLCCWTGTQERHIRTANIATRVLPSVLRQPADALLNEFNFMDILQQYRSDLSTAVQIGNWLATQQNPHKAFQDCFSAACSQWITGEPNYQYTESWHQFQQRIGQALEQIRQHPQRRHLVFSSGGVISALIGQVLQLSAIQSMQLNWVLFNTGISRLLYHHEQLSLLQFNSTAHLELQADTALYTHR